MASKRSSKQSMPPVGRQAGTPRRAGQNEARNCRERVVRPSMTEGGWDVGGRQSTDKTHRSSSLKRRTTRQREARGTRNASASPAAKAMPSIRVLTMAVMRPPASRAMSRQVPGGHGDHLPSAEPKEAPGWMIGRSPSTEAPRPTDRAETSDLRMATIRQMRLCLSRLPPFRGRP